MNIPLLSTLLKKGRHTADGKSHPQRDWFFLMGGTLMIFILIAVWSFVSFQLHVTENKGEKTKAENIIIKTGSIDIVQTFFTKRASVQSEHVSTKHFVDPSR